MLRRNKLTKTLAFPIATGAAAIGVIAGSVLTATSASAATVSINWDEFKAGTTLQVGDKKVTYVSDTFAAGAIPGPTTFITLSEAGKEYAFEFDPVGMLPAAGSFTYTIEILDPNFHFTGAQVDSDVNVNDPLGYGSVTTFLQEANLTLTSLNGWPAPPAPGSFNPIPGDLKKLTVTNTLAPNPGGTLMSSSNKFTQGTKVPEPGTILGLLTVGGLGLVSRFKR
jgi:hypothetical protein